jgi:hypothetical protein
MLSESALPLLSSFTKFAVVSQIFLYLFIHLCKFVMLPFPCFWKLVTFVFNTFLPLLFPETTTSFASHNILALCIYLTQTLKALKFDLFLYEYYNGSEMLLCSIAYNISHHSTADNRWLKVFILSNISEALVLSTPSPPLIFLKLRSSGIHATIGLLTDCTVNWVQSFNWPNRVGVLHPFVWGRKQIQFRKCCVLLFSLE